MNFLAHLYLSGDNHEIMVGNFIADHVRGKSLLLLPEGIQKGVLIHRKIDEFTDRHPVVALSKMRLRPQFGKYAPVITDLYYDHFLAQSWALYSEKKLEDFAGEFYNLIQQYSHILPERTVHMLSYMIPNNWLVSYASVEGISRALTGMSRRTSFPSGMEKAGEELVKNYDDYYREFTGFFGELREFTERELY